MKEKGFTLAAISLPIFISQLETYRRRWWADIEDDIEEDTAENDQETEAAQ